MTRSSTFRTALLFPVLLAPVPSLPAENWPCFRGPTRQGVSAEPSAPVRWTASDGITWKQDIPGKSWSSPIVWENRIFLTTATDGGSSCRVLCLDRDSGVILWNREVFQQQTLRKEGRNSYATPTPVTDGTIVISVFGDGSFAALDFEGEIRWINRDYPFYSQHGLGSSPLLWEDLVIMPRDGSSDGEDRTVGWQTPWDKSFVLALDKNSGEQRWRTPRGLSRIGHVVPNIWIEPGGRTQVLSGAGDVLQGLDVRTGELLWTSTNTGEGVVPSIVVGDGVAYAASGWGDRQSIKAYQLGKTGDLGESNIVWEQEKNMPHIPSYLHLKPYLFTIDEGGIAMCLRDSDGQIIWRERIGGNHSASPVAAAGHIYFTSDEGETTVIRAAPEFHIVARNPIEEKVQASLAVSGGSLFLRSESRLFRIDGIAE
ncbi:MAG TPA: PQQ-binding-like beta-propeller repeat protein [Verrucomicrobiales bacterium]|nr:PQQ-binding-like beta-propeller repeat protein [Verrucomicrobiales bacterium]